MKLKLSYKKHPIRYHTFAFWILLISTIFLITVYKEQYPSILVWIVIVELAYINYKEDTIDGYNECLNDIVYQIERSGGFDE